MIVTIYRLCVDGDMENRKPHVVLFTGAPETVCFLPPSPRKKNILCITSSKISHLAVTFLVILCSVLRVSWIRWSSWA